MRDHRHLWNDLPIEERMRLMPYQIEAQILHVEQSKAIAIRAHNKHMRVLNDWISNMRGDLATYETSAGSNNRRTEP